MDAFNAGDYIRAIDLAESGLKTSRTPEDSAQYYCIIGMSSFALDKFAAADTYLNQTIKLSGDDNMYKQTARLFLLRIKASAFDKTPNTALRRELFTLVSEFRKSTESSVWPRVNDQLERINRNATEKVWIALQDISGDWVDDGPDKLCPICAGPKYRITKYPEGELWINDVADHNGDGLYTSLVGEILGQRWRV